MELIFYDKAARIIGCTVGTLKHAVSRGELTRAARRGKNLCLIKEQVELFKGRRISYNSLNAADKALWHKYAEQVNTIESQSQASNMAVLDEDALMQRIKQALLEQEAERAERQAEEARERAIKAREERERFHEGHPFLVRARRELQTA